MSCDQRAPSGGVRRELPQARPMGHDLVRRKVYGTKDIGEETKYTIE